MPEESKSKRTLGPDSVVLSSSGNTPSEWLRPIKLHEFLLIPDPPVTWLIQDLLPAESLVMISGPRKRAFKTWLVMLLAGIVGIGTGYDRWVSGQAVNTLFIEEEGTPWGIKNRFLRILPALGVAPGALTPHIWIAHRTSLKLDSPRMVAELLRFVQENNIKLVVLDALTYMHSGDENDKRDMQVVISALFHLRAAGKCTVLWLSHTNKEADKEDHDEDSDVRGSSVLLDAYDVHIAARRKAKGVITVTVRAREDQEQKFELYWHIPDKGTPGAIKLDINPLTEERITDDIINTLLKGGWEPGRAYSFASFNKALGLPPGKGVERRNALIVAKKLLLAPDGKGVMIPFGETT